jgi:CDP-paratose 2-epimerase
MSEMARAGARRAQRRVLVTGGCGFLGGNLANALAARGADVLVFDSFAREGSAENADWLKSRHGERVAVERADVRDRRAVARAVAGASAILHLAAQVAVTTSLADPVEDFEVNARGTLNLLEAARRLNRDAPLIFASTNKVYGRLLDERGVMRAHDRYVPRPGLYEHGVAEQAPLDLYSPYGCSKGCADQYVRDYARVLGLRTVVLRMSCVYGPRQFGTEDQGWIAHFLMQAIRRLPITIYGDGYQGGPDNSLSLRELLSEIEELNGERPQVAWAPWRPGDQPWYVSNVGAISEALGWRPNTSLSDGLRALHAWLVARFGTSRPALAEARA